MNWKFWKRGPSLEQKLMAASEQTYSEWRKAAEERAAADKAKAEAEWEALPEHRKAARIEYAYFREMARPKLTLSALAVQQQNALANSPLNGILGSQAAGFGMSPYGPVQGSHESGLMFWR